MTIQGDSTSMHVLNTTVTHCGTTIENKLLIWSPLKVHFLFFKCSHRSSLGIFNWMKKLIIILSKNIIFFLNTQLYLCISSLKRNQKKNSTDLFLRKHNLSKCSSDIFGFKKTVINRLSFIQQKRYHSLIFTEQEKSS